MGRRFRCSMNCTAARRMRWSRCVLPESVVREAGRYQLHPALGDAMLQSMAGAVPLEEDGSFSPFTYMPVGIRRVRIAAADRGLLAAAVHLRGAHVERIGAEPGARGGERVSGERGGRSAGGAGRRAGAAARSQRRRRRRASTRAAGCIGWSGSESPLDGECDAAACGNSAARG